MQGSHLSLQNICGVDLATGGKAVLVPTCYPLMLAARVGDMFGLNGARVAWGALFAIGLSFGKPFKRAKAGADRNVFAPNGADLTSKRLPVCRAARFASILAVRFTKLLGKASATPRWLPFVRLGCSFAEEWRAASQRLASLVESCDKYFAQPAFFAGIVLHRQFCLL